MRLKKMTFTIIALLSAALIFIFVGCKANTDIDPSSDMENTGDSSDIQDGSELIVMFPLYNEGEEYIKALPLSPVFTAHFTLPDHLHLDYDYDFKENEPYLGKGLWNRVAIVDETGNLVGTLGFNVIGDLTVNVPVEEMLPDYVYSRLADSGFDIRNSYRVINSRDSFQSAIVKVRHFDNADATEDTIGILAHDTFIRGYIGFDFLPGIVSEDEAITIANSINLYPVTSGGPAKVFYRDGDYERLASLIVPDYTAVSREFSDTHTGLDFRAPKGSKVLCAAYGTVEKIGHDTQLGDYIIVYHEDYSCKTLYAHCDSILVNEGDTVLTTQNIATVGETGETTGTVLHLELIDHRGIRYNPSLLLHPENSMLPVPIIVSQSNDQ